MQTGCLGKYAAEQDGLGKRNKISDRCHQHDALNQC